jgi:hypothetical protein
MTDIHEICNMFGLLCISIGIGCVVYAILRSGY